MFKSASCRSGTYAWARVGSTYRPALFSACYHTRCPWSSLGMATPCGPAPVTRSGDWEAAAGRRRWSTGAGTPGADWRRPHEQPTAEQARRACGDWEAAAHAGTGGRPSRRPAPPSTAPPIRLVLLQFRLAPHLALLQLLLAPSPLVLPQLPLAPPAPALAGEAARRRDGAPELEA